VGETHSFEEENRDHEREGSTSLEADDIRAAAERAPHEAAIEGEADDIRSAAERAPHETAVDGEADDIRSAAERVPHEHETQTDVGFSDASHTERFASH
jgi:hypothetical protein